MILKNIIHSQCRVTRSLDHLVGAEQNRCRQRDTDQLRGLQIRHELKSRGPLRGQLGHFGALQDLARHPSDLTKNILDYGPIADQPARSCDFGEQRDRREISSDREVGD